MEKIKMEFEDYFNKWVASDGGLTYAASDALVHLSDVHEHCSKTRTFFGFCTEVEKNWFACCECEPWESDVCERYMIATKFFDRKLAYEDKE